MPATNAVSGHKRFFIVDHMVLVAVSALPLTALHTRRTYEAFGLSLMMLLLGYLLWLLPGLGMRQRWHDALVLPAFMALTLAYLFLAFVAFFGDPGSAVLVITAQLLTLVYASFRW
jgi:hypothetical protein